MIVNTVTTTPRFDEIEAVCPTELLPEDPTIPGAYLVPEKGGIEIVPGLVYYANASIWRSVERCAEGIRWRSHPNEAADLAHGDMPLCIDSRGCTIGVSVAPREEPAR